MHFSTVDGHLKSGRYNQLRWVVHPIICRFFFKYLPGGLQRWISEASRGMLGNWGMDVV